VGAVAVASERAGVIVGLSLGAIGVRKGGGRGPEAVGRVPEAKGVVDLRGN
jgi:hypothetical protein